LDTKGQIQYGHVTKSVVHRFCRSAQLSNITTSVTVPQLVGLQFNLSQLPSVTDFTNLYDQYRIDKIELRLLRSVTEATPGSQDSSIIVTTVDYDDANAPASTNELFQFGNTQTWNITDNVQISFVPRVAVAAYSGTFTAFANQAPMWIDSGSNSVQHYGVKIVIGPTPTATQIFTPIAKFYLSMREQR